MEDLKQNDSNEELYEERLMSKSQILRVLKAKKILIEGQERLKLKSLNEEIAYELLNNYKLDEDEALNHEIVYFLPDEDDPEQEEQVKKIERYAENHLKELALRRLNNWETKKE